MLACEFPFLRASLPNAFFPDQFTFPSFLVDSRTLGVNVFHSGAYTFPLRQLVSERGFAWLDV